MAKINILPSAIYNRISAGEVVERPASVIKELVENSLDAGASTITIEIENGGISLMRVSDNGCGVDFEDLKTAFLPHATSKIENVDDLDSISTLGFRGEALASIGAVSKVEMSSKKPSAEIGGKICVEGGKIDQPIECATTNGTTVSISNLFFNTPARLKFLKSPKQEESAITNIVERLMLANPDVAFRYVVNKKTVYNATLKGLKEKFFAIYGKELTQNMVEVHTKVGNFEISGMVCLPSMCRANKTYQTLIINGRYVFNPLVSVAISNAFQNFLMKGKFPVFALNLWLPFEDVDVNVHPSKMEVKFKNSAEIYNLFYTTILETLQNHNSTLSPSEFGTNTFLSNPAVAESTSSFEDGLAEKSSNQTLAKLSGGFSFANRQKFEDELSQISAPAPVFQTQAEQNASTMNSSNVFSSLSNFSLYSAQDFSPANFQAPQVATQQTFDNAVKFKVVGSAFSTYILVESEDNLLVFDQHAAHERILFDKFINLFEQNKLNSQPLLVPFVFDVNEQESELIATNQHIFAQMGFQIEEFGKNSFRIVSVPAMLANINLSEFVMESLENLTKISSTNNQIKHHFATCACKAAVKAGQNLSDVEIESLLTELSKNKVLLCPHGRPVCVKLSRHEIEKMFKRIV